MSSGTAISEQETHVLTGLRNHYDDGPVETDARVLAQQREADRLKQE